MHIAPPSRREGPSPLEDEATGPYRSDESLAFFAGWVNGDD